MRCLCRGKEIKENAREDERANEWHRRCIRRFFGTDVLPRIGLSEQELLKLAEKTVTKGFTVTGVQKKISLHLSEEPDCRMTMVDYPAGYILKPQTEEYAYLPEYEDMVMRMANIAGIRTVPHALMKVGESYAYITKRIDRKIEGEHVELYAMEDFCQLDGRLSQDKYRGSYERCAKIIQRYSDRPGIDLTDFYYRLLLSFVIGNSDLHLKNLSLIETGPGSQKYVISPTYDFLPVNVVLPEDQDEFALTMCGKNRRIRRNDFIKFALSIGITEKAAAALIGQCIEQEKSLFTLAKGSLLPAYILFSFHNNKLIFCRGELSAGKLGCVPVPRGTGTVIKEIEAEFVDNVESN